MISLLLISLAQFLNVFSLVLNSKLLRDDKRYLAMANSIVISASQLFVIHAFTGSTDKDITFIFAAVGGSLGVGYADYLYTKFIQPYLNKSKSTPEEVLSQEQKDYIEKLSRRVLEDLDK